MLSFNPETTNCMGCTACYSVCPKQCITMQKDDEGFLYPVVDDAVCIDCGLCKKVCPMVNPKIENNHPKTAVAAVSKDSNIWRRSASGGAFSEIVRNWADDDTLIVGAAWDGLNVHHIGVIGFDNIAPLCRSKYVSSAIENTFIEIREHLRSGKKAIFCGCPCQVDGLRRFLRKEYENLLTMDLICHGQGSPYVFQEALSVIGEQMGETVISYEFRAKRKIHETDHLALVKTEKGNHYLTQDPYIQLFLSQNALRPSCGENCRYRDVRRPGDLTIADCKGLTKIYPDLVGTKKNYSTVVSNTPKGDMVLKALEKTMLVRSCPIDDVIKYNPLFARHTWFSKDRDKFFEEFKKAPKAAIKNWTKPYKHSEFTWKKQIWSLLPESFMRIYIKMREKK